MDFKELIHESLGSLAANKIRTGLAMLGVVIGIGSVIALVSLGQASQQSVENRIKSLGSNLLTISPGAAARGGIRGGSGGVTPLTGEDAQAIADATAITTIQTVSPEYSRNTQIVAGGGNTNTAVVGVTPEYADTHNLTTASGQFISQTHVNFLNRVAVLGPQNTNDPFRGKGRPTGQALKNNGNPPKGNSLAQKKRGSGLLKTDERG